MSLECGGGDGRGQQVGEVTDGANEFYFLTTTGRTFQLRASDEACTPTLLLLFYSRDRPLKVLEPQVE